MKTLTKYTLLALVAFVASTFAVQAQVKIGNNPTTIHSGSLLELESTTRGLRMPQIALTNTTTWAPVLGLGTAPAAPGMHVYNTNPNITSTNTLYPTLAAKIGEYYWDGIGWVALGGTQSADVVLRVQASAQSITSASTNQILDFNSTVFDKGSNFNLGTDTFTAPSPGYYQINLNVDCATTAAFTTGRVGNLIVNGSIDRRLFVDAVSAGNGYSNTSPAMIKLNAGDTVQIKLGAASAAAWPLTSGILEIIKLSN